MAIFNSFLYVLPEGNHIIDPKHDIIVAHGPRGGLREGGRQQPQAAGTGQAVQKLSLELDGKYLENLWEMWSFMEIIYIIIYIYTWKIWKIWNSYGMNSTLMGL